MLIEPFVCLLDKLFVKAFFACPRLVSSYQQDGVALGIEGEGNAPDAVGSIEA